MKIDELQPAHPFRDIGSVWHTHCQFLFVAKGHENHGRRTNRTELGEVVDRQAQRCWKARNNEIHPLTITGHASLSGCSMIERQQLDQLRNEQQLHQLEQQQRFDQLQQQLDPLQHRKIIFNVLFERKEMITTFKNELRKKK